MRCEVCKSQSVLLAVVKICKVIRDVLSPSVIMNLRIISRQDKEKTYPSDNKSKVLSLQIVNTMIQVKTPLRG